MELRKMLKVLIRVSNSKRVHGKNLVQAIIDACKTAGILGATVLQAMYGYGDKDFKASAIRGFANLPVVIEVIDTPIVIQEFLPVLKEIVGTNGLISVEEVLVV